MCIRDRRSTDRPSPQIEPRRKGTRNTVTGQCGLPVVPRSARRPGWNKFWRGAMMISLEASSVSAWCQTLPVQRGVTTVAAAPLCRSFWTKLGRRGQGGLHQLFSFRQSLSERCMASTASHVGSFQPALYRGSRVLRAEAKRSIECFPNLASSSANSTGSSRQSSLSRSHVRR